MCRNSNMAKEGDYKKGKEVIRTIMWSPPRSLSTTVERSLIENKDIHVLHEPFGVPFYWGNQAASSREQGESSADSGVPLDTYEDVAARIFTDAPPNGQNYVFSKNLSYYVSPHLIPRMKELMGGETSKVRHSFMIRHPAKAISSLYYKSCIDNEKTGYTHFDPTEAGYTAMGAMLDYLDALPDCPPIVIIDADDLLEDPEGQMQAYCDGLGLPFDTSMLSWEAGKVPELNVTPWQGWTDDVQESTGIRKRAKRSLPPVTSSLPKDVRDTIDEAMPIYERMYARRIRSGGAAAADGTADVEAALSSAGSRPANHGWGGTAEDKGEALPISRCCKACVADPAKLTGTILLLISVVIWVRIRRIHPTPHMPHMPRPLLSKAPP